MAIDQGMPVVAKSELHSFYSRGGSRLVPLVSIIVSSELKSLRLFHDRDAVNEQSKVESYQYVLRRIGYFLLLQSC